MEVIFLGTGTSQGIPQPGCTCAVCRSPDPRDHRTRPSILLRSEQDGFHLLIDTSPDLRFQLLRENIHRVDAVLFTHAHRDHTGGLDDLRGIYFARGKRPIPVYATSSTWRSLEQQFYFLFRNPSYPGILQLERYVISPEIPGFQIGPFRIQPILLWHFRMPVLGFRIGPFAYLTDLRRIDPDYVDRLHGVQILVLGVLQKKPHLAHLNLSEALELIAQLHPRKTYFTHIGHGLGTHQELLHLLPSYIQPAWDGLRLRILNS